MLKRENRFCYADDPVFKIYKPPLILKYTKVQKTVKKKLILLLF